MTFLGIDLGTSALKAVLVDDAQSVPAEASVPLRTLNPQPGWSEQNPDDWWAALKNAIEALSLKHRDAFGRCRAIGLSGQMHGAVLLDRKGEVLRPAMLWNDNRAVRECERLQAGVPDLPRIAGVIAMPGLTAPKLLWLRDNEPDVFGRIATVLSPKDYLRLKLSGEIATDMSDAAGTLWLNQAARDWSDEILGATGLSRMHMPSLKEGSERAGQLRTALFEEWSLSSPVVIAAGAGDAAAAAVGLGAIGQGDAFISLGTSAQFFVTQARYRPAPEKLLHSFAHALPERWFTMAAMLNGASALQWLANALGGKDIAALLESAEDSYGGPSRALFLPYLSGERTPHNDPDARGAFVGLDASHGRADLVLAVLEGVCFSLREARECLGEAGIQFDAVAIVGGGARSRFWAQLMADVLGIKLLRYAGSEIGPAFGAARLARLALTGENPEAVCVKPPLLDVLEPDLKRTSAYAERFQTYRKLYRSLKEHFSEANGRSA